MEKVTIYNYEAFFLDFYEGNLDAIQSEALLDFLKLHPELKAEFEEFEQIILPSDEITFNSKEVLLTADIGFQAVITKENFESFAIAKVEGLLSDVKLNEYTIFIGNNPEFIAMDEKYQLTILPTESILFPNQSDLIHKKKSILIYLYTASASVAAALLVWFYLFSPVKVYDYRSVAFQGKEVVLDEIVFAAGNQVSVIDEKEVKAISSAAPVIKAKEKVEILKSPDLSKEDKGSVQIAEQTKEEVNPIIPEVEEIETILIEELAVLEKVELPIIVTKAPVKAIKTMQTPMELIKKEVLNDKPIIEVLADEITAATNEKIKVKAVKGLNRRIDEFALQIGNFSISKKY